LATLLDPLLVRGFSIRNRIVLPPMATGLAGSAGEVTGPLIEHYRARSRCVGMVIVEHSYVSIEGKAGPHQLGVWSDELIPGLSRLATAIREQGAVAVIQINHAGGKADPRASGTKPIAPSPVAVPGGFETPREMSVGDIERVVGRFAEAAERAVKAGFDGVEVHGAHGFLLSQFLSPITNRRRDEFGGSLEGRMRFPLMVVEEVKRIAGGKLLLYRLGADDMMEGGFTVSEAEILASKLADLGVDVIDVSGGLCGSRPPELQSRQGYFIPLAERVRRRVGVPVIGVGGVRDPYFADKVVREGRVDLVAVGRAQLEDPDWSCKALEILRVGL